MQVGWYRPVHLKRPEARKLRLLLSSRQMLLTPYIDGWLQVHRLSLQLIGKAEG
jgi:hypothetical protein